MQALPVAGHTGVDIPRRGQLEGRCALLCVRLGRVRIDPPKDKAGTPGTADAPIDLWAVHLLEEDPPESVDAAEWMLLTEVPSTNTGRRTRARALVRRARRHRGVLPHA
jgi:hypothetical protein